METKNFVVEVIECGECKRTFIVRELPSVPNQPARVCAVCENEDDLAQFFGSADLFK